MKDRQECTWLVSSKYKVTCDLLFSKFNIEYELGPITEGMFSVETPNKWEQRVLISAFSYMMNHIGKHRDGSTVAIAYAVDRIQTVGYVSGLNHKFGFKKQSVEETLVKS